MNCFASTEFINYGFRGSRVSSVSENCRAHAHAGCSLFNGDFEIARHAHGKHIHADLRQFARGDAVANLVELAEMGSRAFGILRVGRDGHEAANFEISPVRSGLENLFEFAGVGRRSALRALACDVDFDQNGQRLARTFRERIQLCLLYTSRCV